MNSAETAIPYEKQSDALTGRACGAACLSMAYRSLGKEVQQAEIWAEIAKKNRFSQVSSTTHLMAQDALNRGFSAVAVQARHPLQALRLCRAAGIRAILNHRVRRDSPAGHYALLVDIDLKDVVLHDPLLGPAQRLSHAELMELWLPQIKDSEIAGGVLIAIAGTGSPALPPCEFCQTPMPLSVDCPGCNKPTSLQPGAVLGCVNEQCIARMWNWVCCPACDYLLTLKTEAGSPPVVTRPSVPEVGSSSARGFDIDKLFSAIDQFSSHIRGIPAAAEHPEVQKQLEFIKDCKQKINLAYAEDMARRAGIIRQLSAITKQANEQREAQRKKMEELSTPLPPLDGDALGRALLKNLGFSS